MHTKRILCFTMLILLFSTNIQPITSIAKAQLVGWSKDIRLTFNNNNSFNPVIAAYENNVHIIYIDDEGREECDYYLCYIKSTDYGKTWGDIVYLTNETISVSSSKISVDQNNIHVVYEDEDDKVHYINSIDNGDTWNDDKIIATVKDYLSKVCDIGVNGTDVHVAFLDPDYKLNYIKSANNGLTWSKPIKFDSKLRRPLEVEIAVNNETIHIISEDRIETSGIYNTEIFYFKSDDNGLTWMKEIDISSTPDYNSREPDIAVVGNTIHVIYADYREGIIQIFYNYSDNNGITWAKDIKLSNSTNHAIWAAIAAEGNNVYVVWVDRTPGAIGLHYRNSSDNGKTWTNDTRLTYSPSSPGMPDMIIVKNYVHLVWYDHRYGKSEIYYKRFLISSPPIKATIDIDPDTLNLKSKGKWITCYIEINDNLDVNDINISTILLENTIQGENHPTEIGDHDNDGNPDLMVKFDRSDVEDILGPCEAVVLKITGSLTTGESFECEDSIRVILKPQ